MSKCYNISDISSYININTNSKCYHEQYLKNNIQIILTYNLHHINLMNTEYVIKFVNICYRIL